MHKLTLSTTSRAAIDMHACMCNLPEFCLPRVGPKCHAAITHISGKIFIRSEVCSFMGTIHHIFHDTRYALVCHWSCFGYAWTPNFVLHAVPTPPGLLYGYLSNARYRDTSGWVRETVGKHEQMLPQVLLVRVLHAGVWECLWNEGHRTPGCRLVSRSKGEVWMVRAPNCGHAYTQTINYYYKKSG